jgi:hypothetical protein
MDILIEYSRALWNAYYKTLRKKQRVKLSQTDNKKLMKILFETKKLCLLVDSQRTAWINGNKKPWPINPDAVQDPDTPLVYTLEDYPHMAPEIKRFMDRSAVEYVKIFKGK